MKPIVAIIGKPNVGKSTLFNRLAGDRISIVQDTPGVTRDRIYADVEWLNYTFTLIDTGGIEPKTNDLILKHMRGQAEIAIGTANVILFVVDGKTGMTDTDQEVATMLRKSKKPVILAVNKIDNMKEPAFEVYEFYNLGLGEPIPFSAGQALGLGDLLDEVVKNFVDYDEEETDEDILKIAIIGKPNVGKSSLVNKLLGEERVIVSDIAGTTRDAIDTLVEYENEKYIFIDTAGIRRKSRVSDDIEHYSIVRTLGAVERSDVSVIMIDAETGITEQDAKIAGIAHEKGKACIVVVNKWDAIEKNNKTMPNYLLDLDTVLSYMTYSPKLMISAKTGQRINKLFDLIKVVSSNHALRISTGVLNDVLYEAMAMNQPPSDKGRRLKIYYMTQISVKPPTFVLFVNDKELMHFSYKRYIENQLRAAFGYVGTPLHFIVRERKEK